MGDVVGIASNYRIYKCSGENDFAVERLDFLPMIHWDSVNPRYTLNFTTHVKAYLAIMKMVSNEEEFIIAGDAWAERHTT